MISPRQVGQIIKTWDKRWMAQDWGKAHFNVTHWFSQTLMAPSEIAEVLGWRVEKPLKIVLTYRSIVRSEMTSTQIGREIVAATPEVEREKVRDFFLSPDAFGERDSPNTIDVQIAKELRPFGLPYPEKADTDRPGGWTLMDQLLFNTKMKGQAGDMCWLISSECPELLEAIPILMRDPKDLDVVLKTDKGQARLEQDVSESARYGLKSMLSPGRKPFEAVMQERLAAVPDVTQKNILRQRLEQDRKGKQRWGRQY